MTANADINTFIMRICQGIGTLYKFNLLSTLKTIL